MRKTLLILTAGALTFTACKKSSYPEVEPDDIYELPYNKESVEANKAFVESEGRNLVKQVDGLQNETAFDALESLSELDLPELELSTTLAAVTKLGTSTKKIAAISGALSEAVGLGSKVETYKLSNALGIYKYNGTTGTWDKTASNDKIEFHFPSTKGGKSNDAVLAFTYKSAGKTFTQKDIEYDYIENNGNWEPQNTDVERIYELPASVLGTLSIGGKKALELNSTFDYHDDNLPKSALAKMTIGAYSAQTEVNNDNKAATVKFTFAKNGQALIAASGNSTFDNISFDKLTNDEADLADLLLIANTNIVVGDITMAGQIDFAKVNSSVKHIENDEKEYNAALAKALNENSKIIVVNTKKQEKIASLLFQAGENVFGDFHEYYTDALLVFGDGSKVSFDTFGNTGFQSLIDDFNDLIKKFKKSSE